MAYNRGEGAHLGHIRISVTSFPLVNSMFDLCVRFFLLVCFLGCTGCFSEQVTYLAIPTKPADPPEDISRIAKEYKTLRLLTPEPVLVNPELAMLCVGASQESVEAARVDHGPHAHSSVNIYMNEAAAEAFAQKTGYPVGSVVVKEKDKLGYFSKEENRWEGIGNGVGGMIKRKAGFDPDNGDWEYFYFEDVKSVESGKMESCIQCHIRAKEKDYVFGSWNVEDKPADDAHRARY